MYKVLSSKGDRTYRPQPRNVDPAFPPAGGGGGRILHRSALVKPTSLVKSTSLVQASAHRSVQDLYSCG